MPRSVASESAARNSASLRFLDMPCPHTPSICAAWHTCAPHEVLTDAERVDGDTCSTRQRDRAPSRAVHGAADARVAVATLPMWV
jgi:hypothetical protein